MTWKGGRQMEIGPGVHLQMRDDPPTANQLVGQLHAALWPMFRPDHEKMYPEQVWEECLKEVRRLKENQR